MIHISENTKKQEKRGTGEGKFYKPWIKSREINSKGTSVLMPDWKTHRVMHFLSRGEYMAYLILRWNDRVTDIREQYPLDKKITIKIARQKGIRHPATQDGYITMTTDLLVTYLDEDGTKKLKAYSVKSTREEVFGDVNDPAVMRTLEKTAIEMAYWNYHQVEFGILFKDELNQVLCGNIEFAIQRYDLQPWFTASDIFRHLIARKEIMPDMENFYIRDYMPQMLEEYNEEIKVFIYRKAAEGKLCLPKADNRLPYG